MTDINARENSLHMRDLDLVRKAVDQLKEIEVVDYAEIDLLDESGSYVVGKVWFDAEQEEYRWDASRYGKNA